uniref:Uncharacterized protein n=1 Tax=Anopheles epiroticus TaxID=199890 RepID=A0A182PKT5_9DIPT
MTPEKQQFRPAERPKQIKPQDNLRPEGNFERPQKSPVGPGERPKPIKHDDNLRPEGTFERPEKATFKPAERPKQIRPEDNLRTEGEFEKPTKPQFRPAERPKQVKPQDNLQIEGDYNTFKEYNELKQQKEAVLKEVHEPGIADGAVLVTTQTVTTILKGDKKQPTGRQVTTSEVHDHARSESESFTQSHSQQQHHTTSEQISSSTAINRAQRIEASTNERDHATSQRSTTKHTQSIHDVSGRNVAESNTQHSQHHVVNGSTVVGAVTERQSHSHSVKSSSSSSKVHQSSSSVQQHTSKSSTTQLHQDSLHQLHQGETRHIHTNGTIVSADGGPVPSAAGAQQHTREQVTGSQVSSSSSKIVIDGKVVTDKSATSKLASEKLAIDGVVVTDKSFVERQKTGFDGMESISNAQTSKTTTGQSVHDTVASSMGSHSTAKSQSQTRSSTNNIIHTGSTNGHSAGRRNGALATTGTGQTTETQVKKLIGGKWVTKTIRTESKSVAHDQRHGAEHVDSKSLISDQVDRHHHHQAKSTGTDVQTHSTSTSSSSTVSKSQSSSTIVSDRMVQQSVRETTASAGSPSGRTGARGSSSIVLGESTSDSSSSKRQQTSSSTTKLIGGKLVHMANDSNNNSSASGAGKASVQNASNAHHSSLQEQLSSQTSSSVMKSSKASELTSSSHQAVSSSSSSQQYNRKNTFASSENVNNSILCRPAQTSTTGTTQHAANGVGGMSVSGSIQRKSISNLNDSAMYTTTNRTSYSSLHRRGKESAESRMQDYVKTLETGTISSRGTVRGQPCPPPTLAGTGLASSSTMATSSSSSMSTANQKSLRDYHSAMNVTRSSTKANASSISFGDDKFHGTSSYKVQYIQQHEGRCPAAVHDNLKLSKVTKQHTYYVREKK